MPRRPAGRGAQQGSIVAGGGLGAQGHHGQAEVERAARRGLAEPELACRGGRVVRAPQVPHVPAARAPRLGLARKVQHLHSAQARLHVLCKRGVFAFEVVCVAVVPLVCQREPAVVKHQRERRLGAPQPQRGARVLCKPVLDAARNVGAAPLGKVGDEHACIEKLLGFVCNGVPHSRVCEVQQEGVRGAVGGARIRRHGGQKLLGAAGGRLPARLLVKELEVVRPHLKQVHLHHSVWIKIHNVLNLRKQVGKVVTQMIEDIAVHGHALPDLDQG
mmetsp:Transcript_31220/g.78347  ORF Transcript_31220/g.78347 Transcript_31220/m.78347 type:complete len:274 (-) Transcript_31220:354-1175(-)